jgi:hypothetical protein
LLLSSVVFIPRFARSDSELKLPCPVGEITTCSGDCDSNLEKCKKEVTCECKM